MIAKITTINPIIFCNCLLSLKMNIPMIAATATMELFMTANTVESDQLVFSYA